MLTLLFLFFLVWHPGYLGSETLTFTTYYPAPYGGYVSLLTTGRTLLARDSENVGIGTGSPSAKLHVRGDMRLELGATSPGWVLSSDALGYASWQPPGGGTMGPQVYQCPPSPGSIGGGAWGFYGCQGQISTLSYCYTIEYPNAATYPCTYIGRLRLE